MNETKTIKEETEAVDRVGIVISALCCIHCMAIPLLVIFAPSLGSLFENPWVHLLSLGLVIPLGFFAFISKFKVHENKTPLIIGIIGMSLLFLGHLGHELFSSDLGAQIELVASVVGGLSLVTAHIINIRLCRCHSCDH